MSNDLKYASKNIKLLLKYKNWTQKDLCKKTGITKITMRRRLNSKIPKWSMLEAASVADAFNLSVSDIFFKKMKLTS
ncbi:helix-turn-helix domain-containing protein [Clostridium kluyveri]|uniref:Predicted transcriptional regulator n=1 Tax=Clostridium kluyveri (strain ATCC 8527 / DSM 555 / NBRC 12016 / NCIMB 10680 / K1) TaxID=431943 RepID=A5N1G8_CLOK5|nr:helix-turn-helix transcriptional regulator [Clostridium kluyveri]EDK34964.1 Predicted transcriptional regulator [Clostridium kluyveri DSM 555]